MKIRANPVYKFLKTSHSDAMLESGTVCIGNLEYYRNLESKAGSIADNMEATTIAKINYSGGSIGIPDNITNWMNSFIKVEPGGVNRLEIVNATAESKHTNLFVYCASRSLNKATIKFARDEGYDSCIEITNPMLFGVTLSGVLRSIAQLRQDLQERVVFGNIDYRELIVEAGDTKFFAPNPFVKARGKSEPGKENCYADQLECRWVFPNFEVSKPDLIIVDVPDLIPLIRKVDLPRIG